MLSRMPGLHKRLRVGRPELPKPKKRLKRSTFATLCAAILLLAVAGVSLITTVVTSRASVHAAPANTAVTTYRANNARTGNFSNETILNTSNVNSTQFGKRVSYPVDGLVYAEPLYVPNLTINGAQHNVVFVATEHDSVYAFDADQSTAIAPLWHASFLTAGVSTVATSDVVCNDLVPEIGITGTPTIDTNTNIMYVVVYTKENSGLVYRLHALDLTTGLDKPGSPIVIQGSVPGTGSNYEAVNGQISFKPLKERQRAALTFANGQVYIPFGSFCDNGPYHGWVFGYTYNGTQFTQSAIYNTTPNGAGAGLWGSGGSVATDSAGNLYVNTGNGDFDLNTNGTEAGDSLVKLNPQLQQVDYFSPFNNSCLNSKDTDLGSGGPLVIGDFNEVSFGGKEGRIYVGSTGNLGKFTADPNLNCTTTEPNRTDIDKILYETAPNTVGGIYGSAAYWNGPNGPTLYMAGAGDHARAFSLANGVFTTTPIAQTTDSFSYTGGNLVISSNGNTSGSGVMWTLDPSAVLKAFDASNITKKLYSSTDNAARDSLGSYVKFSLPTVANGEVFVGTQNALVIYGLNPSPAPATTPTPSPTPGVTYDNVGISDDTAPGGGNYDGSNNSYSAQALRSDGINPGDNAFYGHIVFAWPNVVPGQPDNYTAHGQTIPVSPLTNATVVAFAGSATGGPSSGTVTVNYTDGSSQFATLGFSDWHLQGGLSYGNNQMAYMTYYNASTGSVTADTYLFEAEVTLQLYKTVKSVTLPSTVTGGTMHVFAVTTNQGPPPPAVYNNIATSDDSSPASGNFDGANSYSAQALQAVGITPGGTVTYNGTNFTWPNVPSGKQNNYVAKGQLLSITPVSNATTLAFLGAASGGDSSGTATINYSDGTTQDFALGFGDWTATGSTAQVHFGNLIVAQTTYRNTPTGQQTTSKPVVLYTEIALQPGKTIQGVVLPSVINGGQMHIFAASTKGGTAVTPTPTPTATPTPTPVPAAPTPTPTPAPAATPTPTPTTVTGATPTPTPTTTPAVYNNKGTSDDSAPSTGNFDGTNSYSAEALQAVGITPGKTLTYNGVTFTWPTPAPGTVNNYRAKGQTLAVTPVGGATAGTLAFLGAASGGKSSGTATITYTDGTTQTFTLGFSDWTLGSGTDSPSFGNLIVATATYRNTPTGSQTRNTMIFYTDVALQVGKTLQSVTFPATLTGGWLHIFAVGTKVVATPAVYNNIGTSDDGAPSSGNFDGTNSYSAQALQAVGITPGGTVAFNGVNFTWPSAASGSANNYVANGQQVPVTPVSGATTLAFLGSASAGNSSGTAVITYTDGTTQSFTLGFNDWTLGGSGTDPVAYGDLVVATTAYRNTPTGPQTAHQPVVFYADVALQAGKTIQSVTLPTTVTGGQLHVFAVSTK